MTNILAIPINEISGAMVTEDGQKMLLKFVQANGNDLILAIPRDQFLNFVDMAALSQKQSDDILKIDPNIKSAFHVKWWELGFDKTTKTAVLTLTFGAGGKLSFRLSENMPKDILETLQAYVGNTVPQKPDVLN